MPRAKHDGQGESPGDVSFIGAPREGTPGTGGFCVGDRCRLWWPPTDDEDKSDYAGAFWPVTIVDCADQSQRYSVQYDNEEVEHDVRVEHMQPENPPVAFGDEAVHLQVGEFVEVFNESNTDPAAWIGKVHAVRSEYYVVSYPFHDTPKERITKSRLRRVRLFEKETGSFKILKPNQTWQDGEIESPVELETMTAKELAMYLQKHKTSTTHASGNGKQRAASDSQGQAVKKRKGNPQRAH